MFFYWVKVLIWNFYNYVYEYFVKVYIIVNFEIILKVDNNNSSYYFF